MKTLIPILFSLLTSCIGYEPLVNKRENYSGKDLNLNGYYYYFSNRNIEYNSNSKTYDQFVLYNNGIYFNCSYGGYDQNLNVKKRLENLDNEFMSIIKNENIYIDNRPNWGVFKINNSKIEIENWTFASGGGDYPTMRKIGEIINDTTIHFHTLIGVHPLNVGRKKKEVSIDETYHFRKFSPKPDSTNKWIK